MTKTMTRRINAQVPTRGRRLLRQSVYVHTPPLPTGPFDVIYADPPWQYQSQMMNRAIEQHYPTMPLQAIMDLPVPSATDAVLLLWTPPAILPNALAVMSAWGFQYRSHLVWDKVLMGLGCWFRNQHEVLLLGRKGTYPTPRPPNRYRSLYREPRTVHSRKPDAIYRTIETMFPGARYLELFARSRQPGWASWGNEVCDDRKNAKVPRWNNS